MNPYVTLSGTMTELRQQGYVKDFNLLQPCLECRNGQYKLFAEDFTVDSFYRFEGPSDPSDMVILYAHTLACVFTGLLRRKQPTAIRAGRPVKTQAKV